MRARKIILTTLIAMVLTFLAVFAKNVYSCRIPIHNRGISALISSGDLDILFIGSSTFRANIDPEILDEKYDGRDFILAYGGNQLVATDIQYDEIKMRNPNKTDLIVLELDPLMLTEEIKLSDSRVIWDLSWDGKLRLWNEMAEGSEVTFPLAFEYFITSGMDDLVTYPITEPFYATRYYKGAKTDMTPSSGIDYLENEEFDISDSKLIAAQEAALRSIIDKCKKDSANYVFVESPHYYRLFNDETYKEYRSYILDILDECGCPYILADDVEFDIYNADYFEDMSHMSYLGRKEYTKLLLEEIESIEALN